MKIQDIIWSVSLCLIVAQGLIHCAPSTRHSKPTILHAIGKELSSPHGSCGFPPQDVASDIDSYEFLEPCNRRIPPANESIFDESLIRCMGLLEVGLRLCSLDQKYFDTFGRLSRLSLPNNSQMFNELLDKLSKEDYKNLCPDLKKEGVLGSNQYQLIDGWNFIKVLKETEGSCTKICFDIKNNPNIICKLILWSSNQLMAQTLESAVADNPLPDPNASNLSQNISSKLGSTGMSSMGIESKGLDLESQSRGQQTHYNSPSTTNSGGAGLNIYEGPITTVNQGVLKSDHASVQPGANQDQDNSSKNNQILTRPMLKTIKPLGPDGTSSIQHVLNSALPNFQSENVDGDKHLEQIRPGSEEPINVDRVIPTNLNSTRVITTFNPNTSDQQIPKQLVSAVSDKSPLPNHQKQDTASSLDQSTFKAGSVITAVSSQPQNVEVSYENSPMDRIPEVSQGEDGSFDQNQDADDDVNFEDIDQQPSDLNHEPSASRGSEKNSYKSPQEESAQGNIINQKIFEDQADSHFFSYFMTMIVLCMFGYVVFHNKQKIMALVLEGRSKRTTRRRPTTANYHKLDNNLEEAVSSPCSTSVTHVIY